LRILDRLQTVAVSNAGSYMYTVSGKEATPIEIGQ